MEIQKIAKTVNLAIDEALKELNTTIDKIEYTVLQEPSKGFLGIGSKPAKVLVKLKEKNKPVDTSTNHIQPKKDPSVISNINTNQTEKRIPRMVSEDTFKGSNKEINKNAPNIATDFLNKIFTNMNISVEIDAKLTEKNTLLINLKGDDIGVIIGKRGQTLDSLQYLTNLVVNKGEYSYMSVSIDTADYRERRKQTLEQLAINLAKKAKKTRRNVNLEPMNPYERRIIHGALQSDPMVKTYSEGDEPFRYVVISPK
ncbi:RNA-binding cell elongation regulator Jag/EloR [uncultured Tyzzerella sp.]|uniref:RNA-binding cell elongation regulator Jag/EloR n=1 Tax=uncultured Tyzzerella sp. TaxID=2321398 RepID=UPI0029436B08|nr:RNA-binding cell elongation regulator Jag/EloR [uncultured Tyzzerella sp.]